MTRLETVGEYDISKQGMGKARRYIVHWFGGPEGTRRWVVMTLSEAEKIVADHKAQRKVEGHRK